MPYRNLIEALYTLNSPPVVSFHNSGVQVGYCPHTVAVDNRATIKGLICPYYAYCSAVTDWGQYPRFRV